MDDLTSEAELLQRLRAGDESAYEQLVRQHGGRLLALVRRFLANEDDAREVLQEVFLAAFRSLASFDGKAQLYTWLHRIAVNAALTRLRSQQRKPSQSIEPLLPTFLEDGHASPPAVAWKESSELIVQRQETHQLVRAAIEQLPEIYRAVLLLRDIEERTTLETAQLLGVPEGVVKTRLHRARQALRTLLDPHFRGGSL